MSLRIATESLMHKITPRVLYRLTYCVDEPHGGKWLSVGYTCFFDDEAPAFAELRVLSSKRAYGGKLDRYVLESEMMRTSESESDE